MCNHDTETPTVHIYKSTRKLVAKCGNEILLCCPIGLGPCPEGHKQREGDGRTPEGTYRICTRNARSRYTLFLGLSYPSRRDARFAFRGGVIDSATLRTIRAAHARRLRPPWKTPLGGEIGIHGGGIPHGNGLADSTAGCIALTDENILALWDITRLGTRVVIHP